MIRIRLSSRRNQDGDQQVAINPGETLAFAVESILENLPLKKADIHILVNGHEVEESLWPFTTLKKSDSVIIAPKLKGENANRIIITFVLSAVAIAINPGALLFANPFGIAAVNTLTAVGISLLVNALIPPTLPNFGDASGIERSQMYSISSQSNKANKLGFVPKVYGRHKFFPNVAANPYIELESDPQTGELTQYLYAIYDFGLGPATVEDLRIGESKISQFAEVEYNFVDLNRPATDEGAWDAQLKSDFSLYKGDYTPDNLSVTLPGNQQDFNPIVADYEVIRTAAANPEGYGQEISLSFINPQGLFGVGSNGARSPRTIELEISFAKEGENIWFPWNSRTDVNYFSTVGGSELYDDKVFGFKPPIYNDPNYLYNGPITKQFTAVFGAARNTLWQRKTGIAKNQTFVVGTSGSAQVGDYIKVNNEVVGPIESIQAAGTGYSKYNFPSNPFQVDIPLWSFEEYTTAYTTTPPSPLIWQKNIETEPYSGLPVSSTDLRNVGFVTKRTVPLGKAIITRDSNEAVYSTFKFSPKITDQIKVRVRRIRSYSAQTYQVSDSLVFSNLGTRFNTNPIVTDKRHVFLEMRIKATNQLNGAIDNLSGVVTSILEVYNGTSWVRQASSNPAWIYADLMTGVVNKRAIPKSRLDTPSLIEWANYCDELPDSGPTQAYTFPRYECNFTLDYATTLQGVINEVTASGQASLNIIDGKYGVLIDKRKTTPVQIFTPRNSRDFSASKSFSSRPNALKIKYVEPQAAWEVREAIAYDNGFNPLNALTFQEITAFGITNYEQAYRYGRYLLAQNRLRQETVTINVDFEHLVCTRGDYVQITQDVMKVGGTPARVKSISGNTVVIDDGLDTGAFSYGYVFRASDGNIYTNTLSVVSSDTFTLNGSPLPQKGDLIIIGIVSNIVYDCIVKSINPSSDLTATLTLVERADAIFDIDTEEDLPDYEPQIYPVGDSTLVPPAQVQNLIVLENTWACNGGDYLYYIDLDWDVPTNAASEAFEIYVDFGRGYDLVNVTRDSIYRYIVDARRLGLAHSFKVLAVSATGRKLPLGEVGAVTATPLLKTARPSNVESLSIDLTNEVLQLSWPKVDECDIAEYLIRYSPNTNDIWESSVPLARANSNVTVTSVQARTGIYLIKAVDFNGNESLNSANAITRIPELVDLNVIQEINDFPTLAGPRERVVVDTGAMTLLEKEVGGPGNVEYWNDGYYYYEDLLDLGDIYSVRLQSLIRAEGFTPDDLMSNWITLDEVEFLSYAQFADWSVESEYRTTAELNVISNWNPMSDVNPISTNDKDIWTDWTKFIMGDATGRIFQFRLKLISNKPSVTPRVFDGTIKADMPDRVVSFDNQLVPVTGLTVTYDPAFYGPGTSPNVQISIEDAESGDYCVFNTKTLEELEIQIFDKTDAAVQRTVDIQAKGYGRKNAVVI